MVPTIPVHLIDELQRGNVIAFIGAGFTAPAGLPTWSALLVQVLEGSAGNVSPSKGAEIYRLVSIGSGDSLDQAAQMLEDELGQRIFQDKIALLLRHPLPLSDEMQLRLKTLREIPFKAILTTNVDVVLPGCISNFHASSASVRSEILRGPSLDFKAQINSCRPSDRHIPTLQLHGSVLDPDNMVFTRKGYRNLIHSSSTYTNFVRAVMSRYVILYLGFSFSDYYLNDLRSSVLNMLGYNLTSDMIPLAYAITNDKTEEESEFFLRHEGTQFINYCSVTSREGPISRITHEGFDGILKQIHGLTSPLRICGNAFSRKRIIWNDNYGPGALHRRLIHAFIAYCVEQVPGDRCDIVLTESYQETLEAISGAIVGSPFDLVVTQFGSATNEAYNILVGIKRMQLKETERRDGFVEELLTTLFPAVIVYGMDTEVAYRKRFTTRLGAIEYCDYKESPELITADNVLNNDDLNLLTAAIRALSSFRS